MGVKLDEWYSSLDGLTEGEISRIMKVIEKRLDDREYLIIRERLNKKTLREIGYNSTLRRDKGSGPMCCQRIRQIESEALRKLRHPETALKIAMAKTEIGIEIVKLIERISELEQVQRQLINEIIERGMVTREFFKKRPTRLIWICDLEFSVRTASCLRTLELKHCKNSRNGRHRNFCLFEI